MSETPPASKYSLRDVTENRPLLLALGIAVAGLCLLLVFVILLIRGDGEAGIVGGPTPFPTPVVGGANDVIIAGISGAGTVSLTVNAPTAMNVAGESFTVRAEPVGSDGNWDPDVEDANTAVWVYGTVVNYIVGLPDDQAKRDLLESLSPGNEVTLTLGDGQTLPFAVTNREVIGANRSDVFAQNMPGLTLILLRARGDERLVVQADYIADTTAVSNGGGSGGGVVELGEPAQLGNVRVTVEEATALYDRPEAPPGFNFYVIDFQLENVGGEPIDLSRLRLVLSDDLGNQYATSAQASRFGAFPPVAGVLMPGESRQASVGYQIPAGLVSTMLIWTVAREGGTSQIQVRIPFAESEGDGATSAQVSLQKATVSEDGTGLQLSGQIANSGTQPLVVNESGVSLHSDGTVHLMLSTNPAFPWVVPPGETLPFSVSFQRPAEAQAVFTLLNQPFQLSGLR
ncbi:MAG TPA: DUF4352 domain-containing protein [Candidatus Binatia bacterium]|nr:DUF4352 domain-containing protein [Candidatus Binatia bacterium]